jgi:cytochrome bd ubiquinol oxidase subunit II
VGRPDALRAARPRRLRRRLLGPAGRRGQAGLPQRTLIEHSIGPVWEANHVWLIFVIVLLWTGFPSVFAAVMSTL